MGSLQWNRRRSPLANPRVSRLVSPLTPLVSRRDSRQDNLPHSQVANLRHSPRRNRVGRRLASPVHSRQDSLLLSLVDNLPRNRLVPPRDSLQCSLLDNPLPSQQEDPRRNLQCNPVVSLLPSRPRNLVDSQHLNLLRYLRAIPLRVPPLVLHLRGLPVHRSLHLRGLLIPPRHGPRPCPARTRVTTPQAANGLSIRLPTMDM